MQQRFGKVEVNCSLLVIVVTKVVLEAMLFEVEMEAENFNFCFVVHLL